MNKRKLEVQQKMKNWYLAAFWGHIDQLVKNGVISPYDRTEELVIEYFATWLEGQGAYNESI